MNNKSVYYNICIENAKYKIEQYKEQIVNLEYYINELQRLRDKAESSESKESI